MDLDSDTLVKSILINSRCTRHNIQFFIKQIAVKTVFTRRIATEQPKIPAPLKQFSNLNIELFEILLQKVLFTKLY